nr:immunoglobulin light chain junction region [Macaca mulatta]MOX81159.1 immunoglobulin light chain junction region [Macaca mulatta]MOX81527.1 immunoglobulin light chain junction region [Macaca mulatta]MOX81681.1 immunoglobulin light chain junction region [Macaca mulatta]MOX82390.1 immunoglobulin light chain junction region [Macaca mulatta]
DYYCYSTVGNVNRGLF